MNNETESFIQVVSIMFVICRINNIGLEDMHFAVDSLIHCILGRILFP